MSTQFCVSISTVSDHLKQIRKVKKLKKCIPHELNELDKMHSRLQETWPALVNQHSPILLQDNACPHVARMTVQKLTDLGYETLPHPPYSPDLSPTDYNFLKHLDNILSNKSFRTKEEVKSVFMNFLVSKSQDFYRRGINDLLDRWQRCMAV